MKGLGDMRELERQEPASYRLLYCLPNEYSSDMGVTVVSIIVSVKGDVLQLCPPWAPSQQPVTKLKYPTTPSNAHTYDSRSSYSI